MDNDKMSKILYSLNESLNDEEEIKTDPSTTAQSYDVSAEITDNLKDEAGAISKYEKMMSTLKSINATGDIQVVAEIISDEKNHMELLKKMQSKYNGDIPTAED